MRTFLYIMGLCCLSFASYCGTPSESLLQLEISTEVQGNKLICTGFIKNISDHPISLAALETTYEVEAPYSPPDTYWRKTMVKKSEPHLLYSGNAYFQGSESFQLSSLPKKFFDQIMQKPENFIVDVLPPGANRKLSLRHLVPSAPTSVSLDVLIQDDEGFQAKTIEWKRK